VPEQLKGLDQVSYGSTEAIEGSYHNDIHSTCLDGRHQLIES